MTGVSEAFPNFNYKNVHELYEIVFSGKVYSLDPFSGEEREPLGVCSLRYEKHF